MTPPSLPLFFGMGPLLSRFYCMTPPNPTSPPYLVKNERSLTLIHSYFFNKVMLSSFLFVFAVCTMTTNYKYNFLTCNFKSCNKFNVITFYLKNNRLN